MNAIRAGVHRGPFATRNPLKRLLFLTAFLVVAGDIYPDPAFVLVLATIPASIPGPLTFARGEKSDVSTLRATLPAGKNTAVLGRYVSSLMTFAGAMAVAVLVALVLAAARSLPFSPRAVANLLGACFVAFAIILGVQLPLFFSNVHTRMRTIDAVAFLGFLVFLWLVATRFLQGGADATASPAVAAGEIAVGFVILGASTAISSRLHEGRSR